jgi:hypothetical protein
MLAWSAKSTYRLDIKTIENATALRAAANAEFNSKLLKQYESLSADSSAKSVDYLEALHKQILSDVNSAFANGNSRLAQEYISEIDASVNANLLSALKRDLLAQKNFNQLQQ